MAPRFALRCLAVAAVVFVTGLAVPAPGVFAGPGDEPSPTEIAARVEQLRALSDGEKLRLRDALARFRELPKEERAALREKARSVGEDRLRALAGRDVNPLKERHLRLRADVERLERLTGFAEATRDFSADERNFLHHELTRGFEQFVKRQFLSPDGRPFDVAAVKAMTPEERRAFYRQSIEEWVAQDLAPDELEAYRTATPKEQGRVRREAVRAFRQRMANRYAAAFQGNVLARFGSLDAEQRARRVARFAERARWFEMARLLETDVHVEPDVMSMLRQLPAEEWTAVRDLYEELRDEPIHRRRLAIETLVREGYGRTVSDRRPRLRDGSSRRRDRR